MNTNEIYIDASDIARAREEFCWSDMPEDIARRWILAWDHKAEDTAAVSRDMYAAGMARGRRFYDAWCRRMAAADDEMMASMPNLIQCDY